jgi:glucose-1-phosphate cytidylyltransferase
MNALILCGGKGERLRPLTNNIPKPMIQVNQKPILWYILKQLENIILNKIYIGVGYKSEVIKNYFSNHTFNMNIELIDNGDVDIIDRVKAITEIDSSNDLFLLYGDTISDLNLINLIEKSKLSSNYGTITIWPMTTSFGIVEFDNNDTVFQFKEKPKLDVWINIGYFIMKKEIFQYLTDFIKFEDFLKFCAKNKLINVYKHEGEHFTVNTVVELQIVEKNIHKIFKFN